MCCARRVKLDVYVWTVNDDERMCCFFNYGVDGIFIDCLMWLKEIIVDFCVCCGRE